MYLCGPAPSRDVPLQVTYCSNSDLISPSIGCERHPSEDSDCGGSIRSTVKAFISVGHDEYWDSRQYDSVQALRDAHGVSLLFLSGNSVCWVSPLSTDLRVISRAGRYGTTDPDAVPVGAQEAVEMFGPFRVTGPDEGLLMGNRNTLGVMGGGDWRCALPDHWLFKGTGMKQDDSIPDLVGAHD